MDATDESGSRIQKIHLPHALTEESGLCRSIRQERGGGFSVLTSEPENTSDASVARLRAVGGAQTGCAAGHPT